MNKQTRAKDRAEYTAWLKKVGRTRSDPESANRMIVGVQRLATWRAAKAAKIASPKMKAYWRRHPTNKVGPRKQAAGGRSS